MNKRELLKLGAGGAAALTQVGQTSGPMPGPTPPAINYPDAVNRQAADALVRSFDVDPAYTIKAAMMQTATKEAEYQENLLRKAQLRLNRLASTSPAWREAMFERYEQEKRVIWTRLDQARQFIFG